MKSPNEGLPSMDPRVICLADLLAKGTLSIVIKVVEPVETPRHDGHGHKLRGKNLPHLGVYIFPRIHCKGEEIHGQFLSPDQEVPP